MDDKMKVIGAVLRISAEHCVSSKFTSEESKMLLEYINSMEPDEPVEMSRLKPIIDCCPYCHCEKLQIHGLMNKYFVECSGCKLGGPHADTSVEAVTRWNRIPRWYWIHR